MVSFLIEDIDPETWQKFKENHPRTKSLHDVLHELIAADVLTREADDRGRINLGTDYADKTVSVAVYEVKD